MGIPSRLPTACLLLLLWCSVVPPFHQWGAEGLSSGAPTSACNSMTPSHGNTPPQDSAAPFQVTPGGASVDGGTKMGVTLATVSPTGGFKGFLLQARDANTSLPLGTFVTSGQHNLLSCGAGFNNAVTHSDPSAKVSVVLEWAAPANYDGEVVFRATVVQDYSTYWSGITSEKVTVKRSVVATTAETATEATTTAAPASEVPSTTAVSAATTAAGGRGGSSGADGTTRRRGLLGGFRGRPRPTTSAPLTTTPETPPPRVRIAGVSDGPLASAIDNIYLGCSINKGCFGVPSNCDGSGNCDALFTYTRTSDGYQFEIMGNVDPSTPNAYVAGALSFDDGMGDDSVMACRSFNGVADITMAWNLGYSNSILADQKQGLSNFEMKQIDGKLYCRFTRDARMDINNKVFDLDENKFHVMVAKGPLTADGSLLKHTERSVSAKSVAMTEFETLGSISDLYVILHACFMVAAWVGASSSGMLLARYFKQTWKNYKSCGIDQWFHFHRLFMITTWALTIAGFVLIVLHLEGWTKVPANVNPHAYIGIVSIALCFIQPFIAMCRCAPTDSRRPVFNWVHWFVGNAAQILGITAIFFGLELYGLPMWTWWVMIVFVGFHFVSHILLSIGECVSDSKAKNQVSGIPMKEFNSSRDMLQPPQDKVLDAPGGTFRKAMLALYLVVVWLLVALLLLVIIVGNDQLKEWGLIFWE